MLDPINKLAGMMRTKPEMLLALQGKMDDITGQEGVMEDIVRANDQTVAQTLAGLGLTDSDGPLQVRKALTERLHSLDGRLFDLLGKPDLQKASQTCKVLIDTVLKVFTPPKGLFVKRERITGLLEKYPPSNLLEHFGYANVKDLVDKEGMAQVVASLRFTQTTEWMHHFFNVAYRELGPDDFEEREVELIILDTKWLSVAEKFLKKKYHNVSHLKELGVIFVIPIALDVPGETMRLFTLLLHYLHEVPFYAGLFKRFMDKPSFGDNFTSLLRGDVPAGPTPDGGKRGDALPRSGEGKAAWRVVQRYLAKDNDQDFRLFEPHVNPEAAHWWHAQQDLGRLSRILGKEDASAATPFRVAERGELDLGWWSGLDFVGELFDIPGNGSELVSFDLIDLIMSLVQQGGGKYLYHQQEALWNQIFIEYMGRDRMEALIANHIIDGFIILPDHE